MTRKERTVFFIKKCFVEFDFLSANRRENNILLKDNLDFFRLLCDLIKQYSYNLANLLIQNKKYLAEKDNIIFLTSENILRKKSFLKCLIIMIHEYYHGIVKKIWNESNENIPCKIMDKICELDIKNFKIIQPLIENNESQEIIQKKIAELEEEDRNQFPEVIEYEKILASMEEVLFLPNINNKTFTLKVLSSPSFEEFEKIIPNEIKEKLSIYNAYINPMTKTSSFSYDFFSFLDEVAAGLQSIKTGVDLFDFASDFYQNNKNLEIINFENNVDELIENDYIELNKKIAEYTEYFYVVDSYLDFSKNTRIEFYKILINDTQFVDFYENLKIDFHNYKNQFNLLRKRYSFTRGVED